MLSILSFSHLARKDSPIKIKRNKKIKKNIFFLKILRFFFFKPERRGEFKTKYSSLIKIDLRFGNKVYYKFK